MKKEGEEVSEPQSSDEFWELGKEDPRPLYVLSQTHVNSFELLPGTSIPVSLSSIHSGKTGWIYLSPQQKPQTKRGIHTLGNKKWANPGYHRSPTGRGSSFQKQLVACTWSKISNSWITWHVLPGEASAPGAQGWLVQLWWPKCSLFWKASESCSAISHASAGRGRGRRCAAFLRYNRLFLGPLAKHRLLGP